MRTQVTQVTLGELCCAPVLQTELAMADANLLAAALKALADPARLRLLSLIRASGRATTASLVERLGLSQSTVTHHLLALQAAGFLRREPEGRMTWYSVDTDAVEAIRQLLAPAPEPAEPAQ